MVLVENWLFLHLFISANIVQGNVFYDILERKNAFLSFKKFEKSKKLTFLKRTLSYGFGPNIAIFPTFFF